MTEMGGVMANTHLEMKGASASHPNLGQCTMFTLKHVIN